MTKTRLWDLIEELDEEQCKLGVRAGEKEHECEQIEDEIKQMRERVDVMKGELLELLRAKEIINGAEPVKPEPLQASKGRTEVPDGGNGATQM